MRKPLGSFTRAGLLAGLVLLVGAPAARADRSPPGCSGSGLGISLYTSLPDVHIGDTILYSVNVLNAAFPACDAGATNPAVAGAIRAFVVTPDGVTNNLTLRRTYLAPGDSDFYTNVVSYVVRAQDILPDGTVRATAVDEGDIHQNDTNSRGGGNQGVNTEVNLPCIKITVQCTSSVGETGAITFTGTVTNCGNNTLVGVTVTNFVDNGQFTVLFPTNLAQGQIASFSGSWVPLNPCSPSTVTLVAQGTDQFTATPRTVTDSASTTCSEALTPGIALTTECVPATVAPGQALPYRGTVRNTGNVTLTNVVVVGDKPTANTVVFTAARLAPGEAADFTGSYTAPFACNSTAAFSVSGQSICNQPVSANSSITCPIGTAPLVTVTSTCPTTPPAPGTELVYNGTVVNGGNVILQNIRVFSQQTPNTPVFTASSLAPGAAASFSGKYTTPANACSVSDTLTVIGQDACSGANVTNVFSSTCPLSVTPRIEVTKQCPAVAPAPGAALTYSGTVRNPGNVALADVVVVSDLPAPNTVVFTAANLAVGASASFTGSFPAPTDECSVVFTLTASGKDACGNVPVTANVSSACAVASNPRIVITRNCPEVPPLAGTPLAYTATVQNTGDVTLTNIVVVSDHPTANTVVFTAPSLAPGASLTFNGSYATPADACSATDTLTATGRDQCSGQTASDTRATTCPLSAAGQIKLAVNCPATPAPAGGPIAFTGTVSNPGNVTLTNVVVVNDAAPGTPVFTVVTLAPKASANFSAAAQTPANSCSATASFTATATDRCGTGSVRDTAAVTCPVVNSPAIVVTHECPATQPAPGESATFAGTVSNAGNVTLNNVTVRNGDVTVYGPATLEPNASATFTGSYSIPADTCSVTTTLTATGADKCDGKVVSNTSTKSCPVKTTPHLVLTKSCPPTPVAAGGQITYSGTLTNAGDVTLTDIVVNRGTDRVFGPVTLAPGVSTNFTASSTVPNNACSLTDTWVATGKDKCSGATVSENATTTCPVITAPKIHLTLSCPAGQVTPGTIAKYSGSAMNQGDVILTNIVVINNANPGTPVFTAATLAPGASANFSSDVSVPVDACSVSASLTVSAAGQCEGSVTDTASVTCPVVNSPAIVVTHECPATQPAPGESATFAGTVRNAGNVTLNNVTVRNGDVTVYGPATLEPNASANFNGSYSVPADTCSVTTTLTATGADKCDGKVVSNTSTKSCPVKTTPRLVLTKSCPPNPVAAGGQITYSGTLQNAGNVTLTEIVVNRGNDRVFGPATLAPGASTSFMASSTVPNDACSVTETWVATGKDKCSGATVSENATTTCPVITAPKVHLTLSCPAGQVTAGTTAKYSGTVQNPGNVTLTSIVVVNNSAPGTPVFTLASLAPGASANFSADVSVPADTCSVSASLTVSAASQCEGSVTDTASATCPVATNPQIAVTHSCPAEAATPGVPASYVGRVSNTGNVTLTNVVVVNSLSGNSPVFGPVTLAPGQSADFTASYTLPATIQGCVYESSVTATAADKCTGRTVSAVHETAEDCTVQYQPGLKITFICPSTLTSQGNRFYYQAVIQNVGNVRLENVRVEDSHHGDQAVWTRSSLSVGESHEMGNFATVPDDCCSITTTLRATAVDTCTHKPVEDTSTGTCPILFHPKLSVTKECPSHPLIVGETATFTGTVSNPGDVTLVEVNLVSLVKGESTKLLGPIALAPGQVVNYKATYVVPGDFCGEDAVTATGRSYCSTNVVTASASAKCPVETTPMIMVTKQCPTLPVATGDVFTYSGTVINAGDVTLTDVIVLNNKPAKGTQVLGPITLAPGESRDFTASYKLDVKCCETWDTLTVSGLDQCTGKKVENSATTLCPVLWTPRIQVTKQCQGESGAFTGVVQNIGDVTLTNVTVSTELEGGSSPLLGPIELAPGEIKSFTGTATNDVVVVARGIELCQACSQCQEIAVTARANCAGPVPEAALKIDKLTLSPGQVTLTWKSIPGRFYRVEYTATPNDPAWQPVPGEVQATDTVSVKTHTFSGDPQRFYRVMMLE